MGLFSKIGDAIGGVAGAVFPVSGIANGLAGSLGKGGSAQNQTVMNIPWNSKELEWLQKQAKEMYQDGPPEYFPGSTVAEMDPRLKASLDAMMGFGQGGMSQAGGDALMQALGGMTEQQQQLQQNTQAGIGDYAAYLMNLGQEGGGGSNVGQIAQGTDPTEAINAALGAPGQNPYVDQLVQQTMADMSRNLNERIMPRIDQGSAMNNAYGGSRQGIAQANAIEDTQRQAGDVATRIRSSAYESDANRRLQAASLASQLAGRADEQGLAEAELGLAGANLGRGLNADLMQIAPLLQAYQGANLATQVQGGQAYQQYLQSMLNDDVARYNYEQNADRQNLGWLSDIYMGVGNMGSSTTQNTPEAGFLERLLGGASTGLGSYGMLASAGIPGAGWIGGGMGLLSALAG